MTVSRTALALTVAGLSLVGGPAQACLEIVTPASERRAFEMADEVVIVAALSEHYTLTPGQPTYRTGVGTGRVIKSLKGRSVEGRSIRYQVSEGEWEGGPVTACPERRFTRPGQRYKLYLKRSRGEALPRILLPTDYEGMAAEGAAASPPLPNSNMSAPVRSGGEP